MSYESYNAYLSVTKSTPSEIYKDEFQELVNSEYENTTTLKEILHNGNPITARVVGKFNTETLSKRNDNYQKIIFRTPDYEVKVGDIFEFDGAKWICTDVTYTTVSKSCTVTKSYYDLNVYKNGILYKVPCIVEDLTRLYSMGTDENKYIIQPSTDIIIRVPNNEVTTLIKRGDTYKLGNNNYKVNDLSDIINPGLLILKLEWTAEEQHLPKYSIHILNGSEVNLQQSTTLQLNVNVYDNDTLISPTPSLLFSSSDENICVVDSNGLVSALDVTGSCVITVSLASDTSISQNININVEDISEDNYTVEIIGSNDIIKGYSKIYIANKYNNGVLVPDAEFDFCIISENTPTNAYTLNIINNTQCSITANAANYSIILRATDRLNNSNYAEKTIKLKNIF
jgi:hypothetical protein